MTSTEGAAADSQPRVPGLAVWGTTALSTLVGLVLAVAGLVLLGVSDRAGIAELVRSGRVETEGLTDPEAVDLLVAVTWWGGVGLLVTGVLFVVAGLGFLVYQRRMGARQSADGVGGATVWTYAVLGAVLTLVTTFLPASPILGGGLAGYLRGGEYESGAKVGALAGLLAAVPPLVLLVFVFGGLVVGLPDLGLVGGRALLAGLVAVSALFVVALTVVLSGIGGVVGAALADDRSTGDG